MKFKKDVELDARLVLAGMKGVFEQAAVALGLDGPSQAFGRAEWLKKQSRQYIHQVEMKIKKLEIDSIKNLLQ